MHSYPLTEQQHQQLMQALIHAEAELRAPGLTNPTQRAVTLEEIDQAIAVVRQTRGLNFIRATGARDPLKLEAQERRYLAVQETAA